MLIICEKNTKSNHANNAPVGILVIEFISKCHHTQRPLTYLSTNKTEPHQKFFSLFKIIDLNKFEFPVNHK